VSRIGADLAMMIEPGQAKGGSDVEGNPPILRRYFPEYGALGLDPPVE